MKKLLTMMSVVTMLSTVFAGMAMAKPDTTREPATNNHSGRVVTIPANAVEVAPDIFSLGSAVVDGKTVEGLMIIDRQKDAKPNNPGGGKGKGGGGTGGGTSSCFAYLAKGAKWKAAEPWVMNTANSYGLPGSTLFANQASNLQKWEDASSAEIFGNGTETTALLSADTAAPDGVNEVYFGTINEPGVIAVTTVWGIFSGPPSGRELVEWDQVFDEADFAWSLSGEAGKMDFENIATHEDGHAAGMGHPDSTCTEETMYSYADYGETKKRDLNAGDIAGISGLY